MKEFGERFDLYKSLSIQHVAFPDIGGRRGVETLKEYGVDTNSLSEIVPAMTPYARVGPTRELSALWVLRAADMPASMKKDLSKTVVKVAPTANVYQIPENQPDLTEFIKNTLSYFDYYVVELGLGVLLNRNDTIPELLFKVALESDASDRTAVTAYDIAPDDRIKSVKVMSGKVTLGITKLLQLVPAPVGQIIPGLLGIELNPWEFQWNIEKYQIDAAGRKDYTVYWRIYKTSLVQGFNPTMILKAKKGVKRISARVKATYKLKTGLFNLTPDIRSKTRIIPIWPS